MLQVFLNTKSGPQVGAQLRRRFLRLLNPLQVSKTNQVSLRLKRHCTLVAAHQGI